jgi:hypothetical protein
MRRQYGKADVETAYRLYLETNGFGSAGDAERVFSVPGIEIAASP